MHDACILYTFPALKIFCCYCHLQALAQCETMLSNLGVIRISADDTAGAAQVMYAIFFCILS